jgi:Uma2 family endonuclease
MASVAGERGAERPDMVVTLQGLTWDDFETIARIKGEHHHPRLLYSQGALTQVSPSKAHEQGEDRLDAIVKAVAVELDIDFAATGATLFRRRDLERGIEGDRTYYIANAPVACRDEEIDLEVDPPPDLVIEVEVSNPADEAVETWRRLGVPEVWIHKARRSALTILHLDDQGRYAESPVSRAFPFLKASEILHWLARPEGETDNRWERRLRAWVRDELAKRVGRGGHP